jgi:hypothetical protein
MCIPPFLITGYWIPNFKIITRRSPASKNGTLDITHKKSINALEFLHSKLNKSFTIEKIPQVRLNDFPYGKSMKGGVVPVSFFV